MRKINAVVYPALGSPKSNGPPEEPTVAGAVENEEVNEDLLKFDWKGLVGDATADGAGVKEGRGGGKASHERVRRHAALNKLKEALDTGSCADV